MGRGRVMKGGGSERWKRGAEGRLIKEKDS